MITLQHRGDYFRQLTFCQLLKTEIFSTLFKGSEIYRWFDGHHHFDEICLRCGIQNQMELQKICDKDPEIVVIRR